MDGAYHPSISSRSLPKSSSASPTILAGQTDRGGPRELWEFEAKVVQINTGPTVTQFGIEPGWDRRMREFKEKDRDGHVRVRQEEVSKTRVKVERINSSPAT